MDMPIQIIVILFVALAVGGAILMFSQSTLNHAQQDLADKWRTSGDLKNNILDVQSANDATIMTLAEECYKKNSASADITPCFALFAKDWSVNFAQLNGRAVGNFNATLDTSGIRGTVSAIKMNYDPIHRAVIVVN